MKNFTSIVADAGFEYGWQCVEDFQNLSWCIPESAWQEWKEDHRGFGNRYTRSFVSSDDCSWEELVEGFEAVFGQFEEIFMTFVLPYIALHRDAYDEYTGRAASETSTMAYLTEAGILDAIAAGVPLDDILA